jgi:hypothetical protein
MPSSTSACLNGFAAGVRPARAAVRFPHQPSSLSAAGMESPPAEAPLVCAECGLESPPDAAGWRGYLDDDGAAVMFCPGCAAREFGGAS